MKPIFLKILNFMTKIGWGMILTTVCFIIYSILLYNTNIRDEYMRGVVFVASFMGMAFSGFLNGLGKKKHGFLYGGSSGAIFALFIMLINWILDHNIDNIGITLVFFVSSIVIGAFGGIIGINRSPLRSV